MTSKLKCPFCNKDLILSYITDDLCCEECWESATEKVWQALIQAKQDLEQSEKCCSAWETQALDYKAETIALSGKLEIATNALKEIKKVCDTCRWCDSNLYDPTPSDGRRIAETTHKALEQIEHKE